MARKRLEAGPEGRGVADAVEDAFQRRLLPPSGPILAAVSGGQDSVALLHALVQRAPGRARIHLGHVDHAIRETSSDDAEWVRQLGDRLNVPVTIERFDVPSFVKETGMNLEAAARNTRYRLLAALSDSIGAPAIVSAHTADDRVETVLMHLLRGSGLEGLVGIVERQVLPLDPRDKVRNDESRRNVNVVRPLLSVWRRDTARYCVEQGLSWLDDVSNDDPSFTRNRIRHHLIPLLETYNPSVRGALLRLGALAADDAELVGAEVERAWRRYAVVDDAAVRLQRGPLARLPSGVSGRLVRRAAERARPGLHLSFAQVARCLELAARGGAWVQLPDQMVCTVSDAELILASDAKRRKLNDQQGDA